MPDKLMAKFIDLEEMMTPSYNYKIYKAKFAAQECPKLPYFGESINTMDFFQRSSLLCSPLLILVQLFSCGTSLSSMREIKCTPQKVP